MWVCGCLCIIYCHTWCRHPSIGELRRGWRAQRVLLLRHAAAACKSAVQLWGGGGWNTRVTGLLLSYFKTTTMIPIFLYVNVNNLHTAHNNNMCVCALVFGDGSRWRYIIYTILYCSSERLHTKRFGLLKRKRTIIVCMYIYLSDTILYTRVLY